MGRGAPSALPVLRRSLWLEVERIVDELDSYIVVEKIIPLDETPTLALTSTDEKCLVVSFRDGELRVAAGHERRHLLVAHLHELGSASGEVERAQEAVDAVTAVPEDAVDAPIPRGVRARSRRRIRPRVVAPAAFEG